jgi:hypothetical protein
MTRLRIPKVGSRAVYPASAFEVKQQTGCSGARDTNLANPTWYPLQTNTLTGGSFYFSDPQWTNYPGRFYRIRSP